jgi:RNA polymerase sigma factor (sigma-70 family)
MIKPSDAMAGWPDEDCLNSANERPISGLFWMRKREHEMAEQVSDSREEVQGAAGVLGEGPDALADEEWLRLYRNARAADVFAVMVRRHQPMVLRACLRLAGNLHDAEDAAQSVFLVLAQRPEVVNRSLAGCLHGLARAAVSELHRSRRRRSEREQLAARMKSMFARLRARSEPMEHEELGEELDTALAQLPDPLQQAVILRYLEGHSQQEATVRAGCTAVTMGWRSMKGLQRLRTILGRRGVVVSSAALLAVLAAEARATAALGLSGGRDRLGLGRGGSRGRGPGQSIAGSRHSAPGGPRCAAHRRGRPGGRVGEQAPVQSG